ncbi:polymerase delta-interacting protein 2-like [Pecten maximus]|uniref:polymerase delta-interacting protein 2-like n=1 Tax=Pecten maximus TaxID=6579 RepID=UPI0014587130|nr:polymerase delta-interacting protein 2-like [Pecten maximus]
MAKDIFRGGFGRICRHLSANQIPERQCGRRFYAASRLQEFGKCEETRSPDIPYDPGQLFLHKSFFYRGIILFSWNSQVIEHTGISADKKQDRFRKYRNIKSHISDSKEVKRIYQQYYMVLSDRRDSPYKRNKMEAMQFYRFPNRDNASAVICASSNTDIINHNDIIPYSSTEEMPIVNEVFKSYFDYDKDKVPACRVKPELNITIQTQFPWSDMDNVVYKETTKNIQVTGIPFYLGSHQTEKTSKTYTWMYCIRIENLGMDILQLRKREWLLYCKITSQIDSEHGPLVTGEEPIFSPDMRFYQYVSLVSLNSPRGSMWGCYTMTRPDGTEVMIRIPRMELRCDDAEKVL